MVALSENTCASQSARPGGFELAADLTRLHPEICRVLGCEPGSTQIGASVKRMVDRKRCIVELHLHNSKTGECSHLAVKLYSDNQGLAVFQNLQNFRRAGFDCGDYLVPRPIAYDRDCRLLITAWAEGDLLKSLLVTESEPGPRLEDAADCIARIHRSGVRPFRVYSFERQLHTLAQWGLRIDDLCPALGRSLRRLLSEIERSGTTLRGWTPAPIHRDFSPDHLIFSGRQRTLLDFDEMCEYDPLFDVAHFMAHLRLLSLTSFGVLTHFDGAAEAFEAAYRRCVPVCSRARLALYAAIVNFKLIHIMAVVQQCPGWQGWASELLSEAKRQIARSTKC